MYVKQNEANCMNFFSMSFERLSTICLANTPNLINDNDKQYVFSFSIPITLLNENETSVNSL